MALDREIRAVTLDGTDLGPVEPLILDVEPIEPGADVESFPVKLERDRREFWFSVGNEVVVGEEMADVSRFTHEQ